MISILFNTLLESAPYVVLGFFIAGIMRFYVPSNILKQHLGGRDSSSLFKSVGVGCILPLCSCGTIPLGIGLFRSGATIGNMLAFMTSTPVLSPVLITVSLKLLGWKLTVTLVLAAVLGSLLMGTIGNKIFKKPQKKISRQKNSSKYERSVREKAHKSKLSGTLKWSFFELGSDVSVDILIGLSIASLLLAFLPLEWISAWLGQQELSTLIYVILLGIPVYACSIPSIVVVQGLLLLGATPGAAIAYMIAGPATNLGELNAIRKSMGGKPATFYALALIVLALAAGLITDQFVFPDYQYHAYRVQGELVVKQCCVPLIFGDSVGGPTEYSIPAWHWPFGIILGLIIIYGTIKKIRFFVINPCKGCNWKTYGADGTCGSKCHVRRKYEFFRRFQASG
ncbi:permease [Maribellus maritimus]|uniref:permease n=1 Tax=Maribellus maritimus TaxID=2870838 RepID=UPI001EEC37C8|nr:permease [Maribellus maritimus]MCG6185885.1 permease [Maribellus maritimus]